MSIAGKIAMGILNLAGRFGNAEINDPEQYLARAQKENAEHPVHKLKDHHALYKYYMVAGCPCILIQSKKAKNVKGKAILYLHGGITNEWEAEIMVARGYADHTGMDVWYPLYPAVSQAPASQGREILFSVYKRLLQRYKADHIALIGTSFGGTFGFALINRINEDGKTDMPALFIASSPGGVPRTEEDWLEMERMSKHDPLIHISAVKNIIPMQKILAKGSKETLEAIQAASSPAYESFANVPETYVYYAEETLAGNHQAYERGYRKYGHAERMHMHVEPGMMHGYACMPLFKESKDAYGEQISLLKQL